MEYPNHIGKAVKIKYLLIFVILLIFQSSSYSQNPQWRVFTMQNSQLPANTVGSIVVDRNNIKWIGTAEGMVKIDGNNWTIYDTTNTPLGDNSIAPKTVDKYNNLWVGVSSKGMAKFNSSNWTIYNTTNSGIPSNYISCITIDSNNIKWIGSTGGLGKFDDINWTIYRTTNSGLPVNYVSTIAIEDHIKWIGTHGLYGGMAKFNDTNWIVYNTTNSGIPENDIWDIKVDNWGIKWIGTHFGGGVGRYNSVTNSWIVYNTQNSGLPDGYVLCILPQGQVKWFGTQGGGLARFNDTSWQVFNTFNSPLPSYSVLALALDSLGNLWIGTGGGLAIYNPSGIIGINNQSENTPDNFVLSQNYPNPFNPNTNIEFQIAKLGDVKLIVFDLLGREIAVLVNQQLIPGTYEVDFDSSNYPSGVYFYRLVAGDYTETRKMVLMK